MKNSFEQKILDQLQKLKEQLSQQQKHINVLEQKLNKPTYEFNSSLVGNELSKNSKQTADKASWLHYAPLIFFTLLSIFIGSWLVKISWHAPQYQLILIAYTTVIILFGIFMKKKTTRILGYISYVSTLCLILISYKCNHLLHPQTNIILQSLLAGILISLVIIVCATYYQKKNLNTKEHSLLITCLTLAIPLTLFIWGATVIILYFDRISGQPSFFMKPFIEYSRAYDTLIRTEITQFLLTLYYMLFAFISLMFGIRYKNVILRGLGYATSILTAYSVWIVAKNSNNHWYLAVVISVAIILIGLGFYMYRRK